MANSVALVIMAILYSSVAVHGIKVGVVVDERTQGWDMFQLIQKITGGLDMGASDKTEIISIVNAANSPQSLCQVLESQAPDFLLSLTDVARSQANVREAARQSSIPTIQLDFSTFDINSPGRSSSDGNYLTVVIPSSVLSSVVRDLMEILYRENPEENPSPSSDVSTVIVSDGYDRFLAESIGRYRHLKLRRDQSPIDQQIDEALQTIQGDTRIRQVIVLGNTTFAEIFFYKAADLVSSGKYRFIYLSQDPMPFMCEACTTVDTFYIRPNCDRTSNRQMCSTGSRPDLYMDSSFLSSLFQLIRRYQSASTSSSNAAPYTCSQRRGRNPSLGPFFNSNAPIAWGYGDLAPLGAYLGFANVQAGIIRLKFSQDTRISKTVANWTATAGINPFYDTVMGNMDLTRHYRVATVVVLECLAEACCSYGRSNSVLKEIYVTSHLAKSECTL